MDKFPKLQSVAVHNNDWTNKYLYMKCLADLNGWSKIDYSTINRYKFSFVRGNTLAGTL
jgi:hypothetical protein